MKAIILAAGKGSRLKSDIPKPLVKVGDKELVRHTIDLLIGSGVSVKEMIIVTGYKSKLVEEICKKHYPEILFHNQRLLTGTGQAVKEVLSGNYFFSEEDSFIVTNSDDALFYDVQDIIELINEHSKNKYLASLLVTIDYLERGYRKIIFRNEKFDHLTTEPSAEGYTITGFYIFNRDFIKKYLADCSIEEGTEIKITDFLYNSDLKEQFNFKIINSNNWFGINTPEELEYARTLWEKLHN